MPVEAAERHGFRARCPSMVSEQGHTQRGFLRTGRVNKGHEPGFKERSSLNMSEDERVHPEIGKLHVPSWQAD